MPIDSCPVCHAYCEVQVGECPQCHYDRYKFIEPCEKCYVDDKKSITVALACGKAGGCGGNRPGTAPQ